MPRIAFFPDSFREVNGVAHTARNFVAFAERRGIPMLCVCAGTAYRDDLQSGTVRVLELNRTSWAVRLEQDLFFDPFFLRHLRQAAAALQQFKPDVIHITGPSEFGILGAILAWRFGIPLVASWHTNVHEYAGKRLASKLSRFPTLARTLGRALEGASLAASARFYSLARVLYAPNPTLCTLLQRLTGKRCELMQRGVDTTLFSPQKGMRKAGSPFTLGFVGRLSVEKNVALLPILHRRLSQQGFAVRWLIVGHGVEERRLRQELGPCATFTGVLQGEVLASAYADMDLFIFPSHTDTFGNVILEALASGTPAIVTPHGGPAHIVSDGTTGRVCSDDGFSEAVLDLAGSPAELSMMSRAARAYALTCSWDSVFERVLAAYPVP